MHPDDITLDALDPLRLDVGWDTRAEVLARLVALADEELIGADRQRALAGIVVAHRRLHRVLEEQSPLLAEPEEFDEAVVDALERVAPRPEAAADYLALLTHGRDR